MSTKIFSLTVLKREGDMLEQRLTLNGMPYVIQYRDHLHMQAWPCHFGGSTVILPLPSHLIDEVYAAASFVGHHAILPNSRLRRSMSPLTIEGGSSIVGWCEEPMMVSASSELDLEIDLSRVVTGPKPESPHAIRFMSVVNFL